jgi:chromate reductase
MTTSKDQSLPNILVFIGSLRAASGTRALTQTLLARLDRRASFTFADIGSVPLYNADLVDDPAVVRLIEQIRAADGLLFVTPEYNFSVPGVLKNAIDWASRPAYQSVFVGKSCFVISTAAGALGGARAQGHLKIILNAMLAQLFVCQEIVVPFINDRNENGIFAHQPTIDFALPKLEQFIVECSRQTA